MPSGILALLKGGKGAAPKGPPALDEESETAGDDDMGSPGEMAAEDFANATSGAERYEAFKRMFKACEMEGHSETEDDEEPGY